MIDQAESISSRKPLRERVFSAKWNLSLMATVPTLLSMRHEASGKPEVWAAHSPPTGDPSIFRHLRRSSWARLSHNWSVLSLNVASIEGFRWLTNTGNHWRGSRGAER